MARHLVRMNAFDPLVSIEPGAQAGIRGWAVAAAIIARLKEAGLSGGIDVLAILGPAISDLGIRIGRTGQAIIWAAIGHFGCLLYPPAERISFRLVSRRRQQSAKTLQ